MALMGLAMAAGAVLLAACGNAATTAPDEPTPLPLLRLDPREFMCTPDDLPTFLEYTLTSEGYVSNRELSTEAPDPTERLTLLESWGRAEGYRVSFDTRPFAQTAEELAFFLCSLDRYATPEGAERAFGLEASELTTRLQEMAREQGLGRLEVERLPPPQIGQQTSAVHGSALVGEVRYELFAVAFRQGPMVGLAMSGGAELFSFEEDAANVAALMDQLIREAFEAAAPTG